MGSTRPRFLPLRSSIDLVGTVGAHVEDRVVADRAVVVHGGGERLDLDAGDDGAGVGGRAVARDLDAAVALALDDGGIVVGDAQSDLGAELLGQVFDERRVALGHAGSVLGRDDGHHQLGILGFPVLRVGRIGKNERAGGKRRAEDQSTGEHRKISLLRGAITIRTRPMRGRAGRRNEVGRGRVAQHVGRFQAVEVARPVLGEGRRRTVEHHLAGGQADQAVAVFAGEIEAVQVADHGDAEVPVDVLQRVHHHLGVARIERGDRLVGQDDLGLLHQGAGDGDPLLLAARQRVGALAGQARHVETLQRREAHGLFRVGPEFQQRPRGRHMEGAAHHHVGQHVEAAGQVELLEDHGAAGSPLPERAAAQGGDVGIAEADLPGCRIAQPVDHAQERRLAGTRLADHPQELARRHDERHLVDGTLAAKAFDNALQPQHRAPRRFACLASTGRLLRKGDCLVTESRRAVGDYEAS